VPCFVDDMPRHGDGLQDVNHDLPDVNHEMSGPGYQVPGVCVYDMPDGSYFVSSRVHNMPQDRFGMR
jgi:hypothetical protein